MSNGFVKDYSTTPRYSMQEHYKHRVDSLLDSFIRNYQENLEDIAANIAQDEKMDNWFEKLYAGDPTGTGDSVRDILAYLRYDKTKTRDFMSKWQANPFLQGTDIESLDDVRKPLRERQKKIGWDAGAGVVDLSAKLISALGIPGADVITPVMQKGKSMMPYQEGTKGTWVDESGGNTILDRLKSSPEIQELLDELYYELPSDADIGMLEELVKSLLGNK